MGVSLLRTAQSLLTGRTILPTRFVVDLLGMTCVLKNELRMSKISTTYTICCRSSGNDLCS